MSSEDGTMDASGLFKKITIELVVSAVLATFMGGMVYNAIADGIKDNKKVGEENKAAIAAEHKDVNRIKLDVAIIKDDLEEVEEGLKKLNDNTEQIKMMLIQAGYTSSGPGE